MQRKRKWDEELSKESDFLELLQELVTDASDCGINVRGGWTIEHLENEVNWEVHITEVKKSGNKDNAE